jgi:hypothetical protein
MIAAFTVPEALHIPVNDAQKLKDSQTSLVIAFAVVAFVKLIVVLLGTHNCFRNRFGYFQSEEQETGEI